MSPEVASRPEVSLAEFQEAAKYVSAHAYHTPLLTSRLLSEQTGFDIRLKAEMFQRGGSYKLRGPLNKFRQLTPEQRQRGRVRHAHGEITADCRAFAIEQTERENAGGRERHADEHHAKPHSDAEKTDGRQ